MAYRRGMSAWGLGALSTPPASVQSALQSAANSSGVPLSILQAVAFQESSYNPNAVSGAGAQGLMQLMPATGASLGVTNPFDLQQNANAGAVYLQQLYQRFGNWSDALIAYNEGPTKFASGTVVPSSQSYADAILANAGYSSSGDGPQGPSVDLSSMFDLSTLDTSGGSSLSPWLIGGVILLVGGLAWALS